MVRIFGPTDRDFTTNGDIVLRPLKARVHKEDNGDYYLDLDTGLEYVDYMVTGRIAVVDTPQGAQAFRLDNPTKSKSKLSVKAWHVFYDAENYLIADSYVVNKDGAGALAHLNAATEPESIFTTASDVGTIASFRCVRKSLAEAFTTVAERWGGHLVRDNFSVTLAASIGQDNGVTVRYRKNLQDITCEENWDNVVTKLLPVGKNGVLLNALEPTASLYVTSAIQYAVPYTKTVSFTQDDIKEDDFRDAEGELDEAAYTAALVADLLDQALRYVEANSVPRVNYTLRADVEKLTDIGDTIEVIDERLGVDIMTNVIAFEYDCILGRYTQIEFGNFKQTIAGLASNITASANRAAAEQAQIAADAINQEVQQLTDGLLRTFSGSYVVYDGDRILVLDALPAEDAEHVIRIDNTGVFLSANGTAGTFFPLVTIDSAVSLEHVTLAGLTYDRIRGGSGRLGGLNDGSGTLSLYASDGFRTVTVDRDGVRVYAKDGSGAILDDAGMTFYNLRGQGVFSQTQHGVEAADADIGTMTVGAKIRLLPVTVTDESDNVINDGVGLFCL